MRTDRHRVTHSAAGVLTIITHKISEMLDNKHILRLTAIDNRKAFDK